MNLLAQLSVANATIVMMNATTSTPRVINPIMFICTMMLCYNCTCSILFLQSEYYYYYTTIENMNS